MNQQTKKPEGAPIFQLTRFEDFEAKRKTRLDLTGAELQDLILKTTEAKKNKLPWLKLAIFGDKKTDKGCLRNDENVKAITGVEIDYDGEKIPFYKAVDKIQAAGVKAMLYTSPSHTNQKPRWRVFAPTSAHLPPEQHYQLAARLNGIFDGVADPKSFTLSQSYFFGSVNNNPEHHCHWAAVGNFIDKMPELDARAIGKDETRDQAGATRKQAKRKPKGFANMVAELAAAGTGTRNELLNACAFDAGLKIAESILDEDQARAELIDAATKCGLMSDKDDGERKTLATIESGITAGKKAFVVESDGRKIVYMKPGELSKTADKAEKVLLDADVEIYQRAGRIAPPSDARGGRGRQ